MTPCASDAQRAGSGDGEPKTNFMKKNTVEPLPAAAGSVMPRLRCCNCAHAGKAFKLAGGTHHHCELPERVKSATSEWDTLVEWSHHCSKHSLNDKDQAQNGRG